MHIISCYYARVRIRAYEIRTHVYTVARFARAFLLSPDAAVSAAAHGDRSARGSKTPPYVISPFSDHLRRFPFRKFPSRNASADHTAAAAAVHVIIILVPRLICKSCEYYYFVRRRSNAVCIAVVAAAAEFRKSRRRDGATRQSVPRETCRARD